MQRSYIWAKEGWSGGKISWETSQAKKETMEMERAITASKYERRNHTQVNRGES